jgi:hypothetical protein
MHLRKYERSLASREVNFRAYIQSAYKQKQIKRQCASEACCVRMINHISRLATVLVGEHTYAGVAARVERESEVLLLEAESACRLLQVTTLLLTSLV